jgi:SprB repeat/Secretion system C-terminal sorting domain
MKIKTFIVFSVFSIFCSCGVTFVNAQGIWKKKAPFGGIARSYAVGFSIGAKGYIGTGWDGKNYFDDFWEWDQASNIWTQKASVGGVGRGDAVGFSIGTKGYIGTGLQLISPYSLKDFWEWDQTTNVWTQKANFGGLDRRSSVGFSIGTKGYIGIGGDVADFWEWNQVTDVWTQKADFAGGVRRNAVAFSIGAKGYIGTGSDNTSQSLYRDFWEWDQATNLWTQKADFGGTGRSAAVGFSIGNKGYVGTGWDPINKTKDFWEWDQASNVWIKKDDVGGTEQFAAVGFSLGTKGYIGLGGNGTSALDFWEYTPDTTLKIAFTNVKCFGENNGLATVITYSGTTPFTYLWSTVPAQTTVTASNLGVGTYSVKVTDALNKVTTATVTITQPDVLQMSVTLPTTVCSGECEDLSANVTGGSASYIYSWLPGNMTWETIHVCPTSLTTYSVTVSDLCGIVSATTTVSVNPTPTSTVSSVVNASDCIKVKDGSIAVNVLGGTTPYSYKWNNGKTSNPATGLAAGNYFLTITDAKGCTNITTGEVSCPFAPIKNLQFNCKYQTPHNCFSLSWSPPNSSLTDTLVGYNIYRNNSLYLFTTGLGIYCDPCIGSTNTTYCGFMYNPTFFYIHVSAVYNKSHIESAYKDSINNPGCGLIVGVQENTNHNKFQIFPNPFSVQTDIRTENILANATLILLNSFGQVVKQIDNLFGQEIILHRDNLPSGLYFVRLIEGNKTIVADKLVIVDR